jgi:hypothetical protein
MSINLLFYALGQISVIFLMTKRTLIQKRISEGYGSNQEPHHEKYEYYILPQGLVHHHKCRKISFYYFDVK